MSEARPATAPAPSSASRELVLGLPRAAIPGGLDWRGVRGSGLDEVLAAFAVHGEYRRRVDIEDDPSFQQLIPYVVVRDADRMFLMRRLRTGGDTRLHERFSIGVGGHIGPDDGGLAGGLTREWAEEMAADWAPAFERLGLLNDDTDPVGAVHLGVVHLVEAAGRPVAVRETHKLEGWFATLAEVDALGDRLETWSRLVLDHLATPDR
jgi:predicted NUDIX family phosphoesterase